MPTGGVDGFRPTGVERQRDPGTRAEGEDLFDHYRLALSSYTSAFSEQVARVLAAHAAMKEPQTTRTAAALVLCGRAVMAMGSLKRARSRSTATTRSPMPGRRA
jgi:hypothetical protein